MYSGSYNYHPIGFLSNACGSLVVLSSERTENKEGLYSILKELRAGREADM